MFKFGEFAQFTPEGSWKVLKVSENVWKATHILRFIMLYHHLEPFFLYEHGQFGIPCFWTKPWSMFRQTPTGGCLACLLPSCSEQHQDFCHILQPRGFLFQQTWGWVKNLWNTIVPYLGGMNNICLPTVLVWRVPGFWPPKATYTAFCECDYHWADPESLGWHWARPWRLDTTGWWPDLGATVVRCGQHLDTLSYYIVIYSYIIHINSWRWVYHGVHGVTASINHRQS